MWVNRLIAAKVVKNFQYQQKSLYFYTFLMKIGLSGMYIFQGKTHLIYINISS